MYIIYVKIIFSETGDILPVEKDWFRTNRTGVNAQGVLNEKTASKTCVWSRTSQQSCAWRDDQYHFRNAHNVQCTNVFDLDGGDKKQRAESQSRNCLRHTRANSLRNIRTLSFPRTSAPSRDHDWTDGYVVSSELNRRKRNNNRISTYYAVVSWWRTTVYFRITIRWRFACQVYTVI